jgi:hypothetical protein
MMLYVAILRFLSMATQTRKKMLTEGFLVVLRFQRLIFHRCWSLDGVHPSPVQPSTIHPCTVTFTERDNGMPNRPVVLYGTFHFEHQPDPLNGGRSSLLLLVVRDHNDWLVFAFIDEAAIVASSTNTTQSLCIVSLTF